MDNYIRTERFFRRSFLGADWRIHAVNPAGLIDFRVKGLTVAEIQEKVDKDFDSGSFPVLLRFEAHNGTRQELTRTGNLNPDSICRGQVGTRRGRYLVFQDVSFDYG